jgi:hypothetical protein
MEYFIAVSWNLNYIIQFPKIQNFVDIINPLFVLQN